MLYGKRFLPDYPQCLLKMGRFRGSEITGEIVDNRQEHMNAFAMVREGMAFLERTMPLGARFPAGKIFREDRFPVPLDAIREILLNAVMHRDYSTTPAASRSWSSTTGSRFAASAVSRPASR
jgi:ATP-dependent DNA helicase RecG